MDRERESNKLKACFLIKDLMSPGEILMNVFYVSFNLYSVLIVHSWRLVTQPLQCSYNSLLEVSHATSTEL